MKVRHEEPPASPHDAPVPPPGSLEAARGGSGASAPSAGDAPETANRLAIAPRGAAPAVALKRAHEQFTARKYKDAARSWNDWAQRAPSGSWTVQIAAIRLDQAGTGRLDGLGGRDGVFVLPSGALAGGLSPVCVGVYPSEEAARRAAASMAPYPGSSSKPIAKPLSSVANSGHVP